jgi:hypothetical protein
MNEQGLLVYKPGYGVYLHDIKEEDLLLPQHVHNPPGIYRRVHKSCLGEEYILSAYAVGINNGRGGWIDIGSKYAYEVGLNSSFLEKARPNDRTLAPIYTKRLYRRGRK